MAEQNLQMEQDDNGVLTVTLHRPDKLNSLNDRLLQELQVVLQQAKSDPDVKVILLTGRGKAFCAGADINRLLDFDKESGEAFALQGQKVFRLLETLGKPSLAAINGFCFGGGCELAMAATMRIASTKAKFGQPEVKLGVIPGYGGTQRLARLVGKGRALDLCLTGRFINADEALQWGLVSEVVTEDLLLTRAREILQGLLQMAPLALSHVMEVIDQGFDLPLPEALALEVKHFGMTCETKDKHEGVSAFLEKRQAKFTGE